MKKRRWPATLFLGLAIGVVVYHASLHAPTGPAEGDSIPGAIAEEEEPLGRQTFRLGTFNIHGCKGRDGRRDLVRVAECLADLDFVALNEVHGPRLWQKHDQAERLGRRLGMAWLFAPAVRTWYHMESGNGLLSALPVDFWQRIPLARKHDHSHRNAVLVALRHRGSTIHVLLTHISRRYDPERRGQLRAVIALFLALAEPSILAGDMNSDQQDPQIRRLLEMPGVDDPVGDFLGPKRPEQLARRRIDWIFTRGLRCVGAGIEDSGASDHPMIWAELGLATEPRPPA